jgi:ankyrin repeat protein
MASGAGAGSAMREAAKEGNLEEVKKQLEAGAPINYRDRQGNTALHISALFGHREIVHLLLQNGADKTIKNNYGETPDEAANGVVLGDEIKNWSN